MKILLISYEDYEYDGRLRALMSVFSKVGDLTCFIGGGPKLPWITECRSGYPVFVAKAIKFARQQDRIDVLVLDNRKATVPGLVIRKICRPTVVIQDCREFYRTKEVKHLAGKIGCFFEQKMIRRADVLIAANEERAQLMKKEYKLKETPLVYENLRRLEYESDQSFEEAKKKIDSMIGADDCVRIISSSGCDINRTNDVLVKNLAKIEKKVRLFLVGVNTEEDEKTIRALAAQDNKNDVVITGRLNQSELKYLISRCDIGVVNYGQYDTNNIFCASGKIYEFIYESVPVITTTNPPLKRLCDEFGIGEADDGYCTGINKMLRDYDRYKQNVIDFAAQHTVRQNDQKLKDDITESLKKLAVSR